MPSSLGHHFKLPFVRRADGERFRASSDGLINLFIVVAGAAVFALGLYYNLFEEIADFVSRHEEWQLDEIINILLFGGVTAMALCARRNVQLKREVERREHAERQAQQLARHDPLTGLGNRRYLFEELERRLGQNDPHCRSCFVLLIDLDRFKPVSDFHGHATGDIVLREVARRLQSCLGPEETIARLGGDEFAVIVEAEPCCDGPTRLAAMIMGKIAEPIVLPEGRVSVGASVGVAFSSPDQRCPEELVRAADLAMYRAKKEGRGIVRYFDPSMDAELRRYQELESKVRRAVESHHIKPHYQPLVRLETREIIGFELLARWYDGDEGIVMPSSFIPVAEDAKLLPKLCYSLLRQACREARFWPKNVYLSLNISPSQLRDAELPGTLLSIMAEEGFQPERLEIEITENALIGELSVARQTLQAIRAHGIRIAIDDFGAGYSGFFHLRELTFDRLKIDRSFIENLDDPESAKIVHTIANLGKSLGLSITAEGIETPSQVSKLLELGCEYGQGYHFGKPRPATANEIGMRSQGARVP